MTTETCVRPMIHVLDLQGASHDLSWEPGDTLMEALRDSDLPILASCGGCTSCATCHVLIDPAWQDRLPARSQDELDLLVETGAFDDKASRLSCQIPYSDGLKGLVLTLAAVD